MYFICFYDGCDTGYVSYNNDPTFDFDSAITFNTEKEADLFLESIRSSWQSRLEVTNA